MYYRRRFSFTGFLIASIFAAFYYHPKMIVPMLITIALLALPGYIIYTIIRDNAYKNSIKYVHKRYVFNQYTLTNDHCTVKYTPDEKLVVTDNINKNTRRDIRTFTISKSQNVNVNKLWNNVCKVFDDFVCLDSLVCFFNYDTTVNVKTIKLKEGPKSTREENITIDTSKNGPKFVDMNNVRPDTFAEGSAIANKGSEHFVNMENIQEAPKTIERQVDAPEFVEMGEVLSKESKQIDVNNATASEISILPGINIVMAKKIVEFRDTNGLFKNEEDFFKVANVKEHFIPKIKAMIKFGNKPTPKNDDDNDEGRIIDF